MNEPLIPTKQMSCYPPLSVILTSLNLFHRSLPKVASCEPIVYSGSYLEYVQTLGHEAPEIYS